MNKGVLILFGFIMCMAFASALDCELSASLVSQDPYPAIPGDYVKVVFQVDGVGNSECGDIEIKLLQSYPFTLDPGEKDSYSTGSFFARDYASFMTVPFKIRIDNEALDGENSIELSLKYNKGGNQLTSLKKFNITIEDARTSFEVYVKNYDYKTNIITFEVLNTGENDVEAVTMKILPNGVKMKGSNVNIVGDLDSNEYTTADFEIEPNAATIPFEITYTDSINVRRSVKTNVEFNPEVFDGRKENEKSISPIYYVIAVVVVAVLIWWFFIRRKKRRDD